MMSDRYKRILAITVLTTGICLTVYSLFTGVPAVLPEESAVLADTVPAEPQVEYGLMTDSFHIHKGEIKPNQFLADILLKHHVPYPEIERLVANAKEIFDVRRMMAGKNYAVFCSLDSTQKARCFIYEPNSIDYVVFDMRDSISIYKGKKEVVVKERSASGVIKSSLYETLLAQQLSPVIALELSEIYAWSIDFYRIQKGDRFKVIFEERFVEGESIGVGRIKASLFNHWGEDFYAFYFDQDSSGRGDYFDEKARSLRKAFLQAPLKFSRISSGFSRKRFHPVQKRYKAHLGTDYAAPKGTPIMSVGDGVVAEAKFKKFNGRYVKIRHNGTYSTQYLHMSKIANGIKPGKKVKQGDVIGYVGSTGLATGPHVCFRFWKNGAQVDHRKEKFPPSKPVNKDKRQEYQVSVEQLKMQLDEMPYKEKKMVLAKAGN